MTVKEALLEYVANLTEEEAITRVGLLLASGAPGPMTAEQLEAARRAIAKLDAGEKVSHVEAKRRFGIV